MRQKLLLFCFLATLFSSATADPCNQNFGGCDQYNGLCWGTGADTHYCSCKAGYVQQSSSPHICEDENECAENPCDDHADCINTQGSFECRCHCGYILDYTGQHCLEADKVSDVCQVPASCTHKDQGFASLLGMPLTVPFSTRAGTDYEADYTRFVTRWRPYPTWFLGCECEKGFAFNSCGFCVDLNECFNNPCRGINSECVNTEGSYYCRCTNGYVLGPCRERCYAPGSNIPELCQGSDLESLRQTGFAFRTFNRPIVLRNYRTCAAGKREGETTVERYDLDFNRINDIILTWVCNTGRSGRQVSVLKTYAEEEAYWGQWSCWTACKATCWGGLQTRVRMCRNGLPGSEGCEGSGTEKRECYTGPKCDFRIRKDAETLTSAEINDLVQAMRRYKSDMSARGFHSAASAHGWPFQCEGRESCCPHGAKMKFITWHRTILLNYEEGLVRYLNDKKLGIPYWNWLRSNRDPPSWAWNRFINGRENPFTNMTVLIDRKGSMRTIQRDSTIFRDALTFAVETWANIALDKIRPHIMHEFSESLESAHGGPHVSVCGNGRQTDKCTISLAVLDYAGFDPLFMLHHSQVDRLWAVSQKKMEDNRETTWSTQTALEVLERESDFGERHMPFGNTTLNPFPIVQAVNTMRDSYYYEELTGVKYDTVENDGYPRVLARALRPAGGAVLLIAHYFQSTTRNFYVNYYRDDADNPMQCSQMTERQRLGGALRLGTTRPFRLTIPHLATVVGFGNFGVDSDLRVKACYTANQDCRERCPELRTTNLQSMPDPNVVYYIPNTPADIYKFQWEAGRRMPNWYINLDARSQYLFFFGNRSSNIRQVRTASEFLGCNSRRSRPIDCSLPSGGACVLPSGIYYLIDSDSRRCREGLRLVVVSRFQQTG